MISVLVGLLLVGCGEESQAPTCDALQAQAREVVGRDVTVVLGDGDDRRVTAAMAALGAGERDDLVVLARYGPGPGTTEELARFSLGGIGGGSAGAANARLQRDCLTRATLNTQPSGGDLLANLDDAAALGSSIAGAEGSVRVLAFGASRHAGDGFRVDEADFSTVQRVDEAVRALIDAGLLVDLSGVDLFFVHPTEGMASSISAAGVRDFLVAYCAETGASRCEVTEAVPS